MIDTLKMRPDDLLSHDHSEIDILADTILGLFASSDHVAIFNAIDLFWARLAVHIRAEHLHLFPALTEVSRLLSATEAAEIQREIGELHEDHNFFMRELIEAIKIMRKIVAAPDQDECERLGEVRSRIERVLPRLLIHNEKEESDIYPMLDRFLLPEATAIIRTSMRRELDNLPPRFISR